MVEIIPMMYGARKYTFKNNPAGQKISKRPCLEGQYVEFIQRIIQPVRKIQDVPVWMSKLLTFIDNW